MLDKKNYFEEEARKKSSSQVKQANEADRLASFANTGAVYTVDHKIICEPAEDADFHGNHCFQEYMAWHWLSMLRGQASELDREVYHEMAFLASNETCQKHVLDHLTERVL